MDSTFILPTIDIQTLLISESTVKSEEKSDTIKHLISAFSSVGLAYLKFDGHSRKLFDDAVNPAFAESRRFFARPHPDKFRVTQTKQQPGVTRGYLGAAAESGAEHVEWKEAFSWSYEWENTSAKPRNQFEAPNIWPATQSSGHQTHQMKTAFNNLFHFMHTVMLALADALEHFVAADKTQTLTLRSQCVDGETISLLRAFHYLQRDDSKPDMTGSCAHTDWGFATLVAQEYHSENALQVCIEGVWRDVPPKPHTLVVNCSDFLSVLTKGRLKSPLHRVVLTQKERFSFVYFQYPGYDTPMPHTEEVSNLSLMKDQSVGMDGRQVTVDGDVSFGQYIAHKWEQVQRT